MFNLINSLNLIWYWPELVQVPVSRQLLGGDGKGLWIDDALRARVLADTGEVMDKIEKKDLNIEVMKNKFTAVDTIQTILIGISILMIVIVICRPFRQEV